MESQLAAAIDRLIALCVTPQNGLPIRFGTSTLTSGVSPPIAATLLASTVVHVSRLDPGASSAIGSLGVANADLALGAPGTFTVRSLTAAGAAATGDASAFAWIAVG